MPETTIITVKDFPLPLWRRIKGKAGEEGLTIPELLTKLLTLALDQPNGKRKP